MQSDSVSHSRAANSLRASPMDVVTKRPRGTKAVLTPSGEASMFPSHAGSVSRQGQRATVPLKLFSISKTARSTRCRDSFASSKFARSTARMPEARRLVRRVRVGSRKDARPARLSCPRPIAPEAMDSFAPLGSVASGHFFLCETGGQLIPHAVQSETFLTRWSW